MMSRKALGILLGILVVLGITATLTGRSRYGTAVDGGFVELLPDLDPGSVQTFRAWLGSLPDEKVELSRSGEGWTVRSRWDWKAKDDLVKRLLDDLAGLRGERRAADPDVLVDFQADDSSGVHVVAEGTGGSELFHLVVGKASIRGGGFVRHHDSDEVYLTQAALRSSFGVWGEEAKAPDAKRWVELRAHQADRNDVDRIILRDGGGEIILAKDFELVEAAPAEAPPAPTPDGEAGDSGGTERPDPDLVEETAPDVEPELIPDRTRWTWRPDARGEFDKTKADGVLSTLCSLYAFDVADPESLEAYGLAEPSRSVEIVFEEESPVSIHFGAESEDETKVYFKVGQDGKPALIYKSTVDRIFPGRDGLKPEA